MRLILHSRASYVLGALVLIGIATILLVRVLGSGSGERITATVERGDIAHIVSVSGVVDAENAAHLAFPVSDIVTSVRVSEGEHVESGTVLATLRQADLQASRQDAVGALEIARADRDELLAGPTSESRDVTDTSVAIAEEDLDRTIAEEAEKVENARRTLLSTDLEARPENPNTEDEPPTVTGTYTCESEGTYTLEVFRSNAPSGYSYKLGGLERGTYTAYADAPAPLGSCGLFIQFASGEAYNPADWIIEIPNKRSSSYVTNVNAYELALQQERNAVRAAEQALELARKEQSLENASPRDEALRRANARVTQAAARLTEIDSRIANRTLTAPFAGTVTDVDIVSGEIAGTEPVITMIGDDTYKLSARIPEIDITRIEVGQPANVVFDARTNETIPGTVVFISPLATEIDGVAYFDATVSFPEPPSWIRSGLNADITIFTNEVTNVLRIPERFLIEEPDGSYSVRIPRGDSTATTSVEVGFIGNDGFAEVTGGLEAGEVVIAP